MSNKIRLNRTFMELKLGNETLVVVGKLRLNRTFMELKQLEVPVGSKDDES